jgi:hypothetical protein
MFGRIRSVFGHSRLPFSRSLLGGRGERSRTHNPQFIGHLTNSGFRARQRWRSDKAMRRRQALAAITAWAAALLFAWIIVESAKALQMF